MYRKAKPKSEVKETEKYSQYWHDDAQKAIASKRHMELNKNVAKNIILFLGDGMSFATIKAARVYMGQQNGEDGERTKLAMENFPFTGIVKTYCLDTMIPESACTATAFLCGIKGNYGTVGVNGFVKRFDCNESKKTNNRIDSIAGWAQAAGKRTGFVTTATVTDASPAGIYAHTANRNWENDANMVTASECEDSAYQLIHGDVGKKLNVIMGGGRQNFLPETVQITPDIHGKRLDGRNLIEEWLDAKKKEKTSYVSVKTGLNKAVDAKVDYLLGLFANKHMNFILEDRNGEYPTLEEMTEAAIKLLSKGKKGYFLFVEAGLIDKAHHQNRAYKAITEAVELSKAVRKATKITDARNTLIVVISDHSQGLGISGPAARGSDVLRFTDRLSSSNKRYTILSYTSGPGHRNNEYVERLYQNDTFDVNLQHPALVPNSHSFHSGEDVAVFALGPWAHLFSGVTDQHVLPHIMAFASCIGKGETVCKKNKKRKP
ncbi:hypothetical protein Trydic_g19335 [Trypoxylus dichotomus]